MPFYSSYLSDFQHKLICVLRSGCIVTHVAIGIPELQGQALLKPLAADKIGAATDQASLSSINRA